jgi:hypothetical protein
MKEELHKNTEILKKWNSENKKLSKSSKKNSVHSLIDRLD